MRLPRDIDWNELVVPLRRFDYEVMRTTGSHLRLATSKMGKHQVTIPKHSPLRVGTLNRILADVPQHLGMEKSDLIEDLFA